MVRAHKTCSRFNSQYLQKIDFNVKPLKELYNYKLVYNYTPDYTNDAEKSVSGC